MLNNHIKEIRDNGYENTISKLTFENNVANIFQDYSNKPLVTAYKINERDNLKLSREMEENIFILIKIYLFNLDLQKYISLSQEYAETKDFEKYTIPEKCFLISKEWISEYKKYYLYDELNNYLKKEEIKKKLEIDNGKKNRQIKNYNEMNVKKIYEEIKDNADFFKKYYNMEPKLINEKLIEPRLIDLFITNDKKIKYYEEFALINIDLKNSIIVNQYKKLFEDNEFIFNMFE